MQRENRPKAQKLVVTPDTSDVLFCALCIAATNLTHATFILFHFKLKEKIFYPLLSYTVDVYMKYKPRWYPQ